MRGTAQTDLMPEGVAQINGIQFDVVARGAYIKAGCEVSVSRVEGDRVYVDPVSSDSITDGRPT